MSNRDITKIKLSLNGKTLMVPVNSTLLDIVNLHFKGDPLPLKGISAAVNREIVFRSQWDTFLLKDSYIIEILNVTQGG